MTSFLVRCLRANIEHLQSDALPPAQLDVTRVLPRYKHSTTRLLLIDFEGTIWERDIRTIARNAGVGHGGQPDFVPPEDALRLLSKLAQDPRNEVWLLSGLPTTGILDVVAEKVPKIGIV